MQENGLESELKNNIYRWVKTRRREINSSDHFCRKCQIHWDKRIHKSLNSMCSELGISLAKIRSTNEREEILNKWSELSNFEVGIQKYSWLTIVLSTVSFFRLTSINIDQFMLQKIFLKYC